MTEVNDMQELRAGIDSSPEAVVVLTQPSWCVPCRRLKPHLEKLEQKHNVLVVDLDTVPAAIAEFEVRGVPRVMLYRNGEYTTDLEGRTVVQLTKEINDAG